MWSRSHRTSTGHGSCGSCSSTPATNGSATAKRCAPGRGPGARARGDRAAHQLCAWRGWPGRLLRSARIRSSRRRRPRRRDHPAPGPAGVTGALVGSRCRPSRLSVERARTTRVSAPAWGSGEAGGPAQGLRLIYQASPRTASWPGPLPWPLRARLSCNGGLIRGVPQARALSSPPMAIAIASSALSWIEWLPCMKRFCGSRGNPGSR